jgi:uncharacterized protein YbjT (DUF2867 family)
MSTRRAWVAGATGVIGGYCLDALLADADYAQVHALVRRPLARPGPRLTVHVVDYDQLDSAADLPAADDAYCCLGTTMKQAGSRAAFERVDFEYVRTFARCALAAGATQFLLVSAVGADAASRIFYDRVKGRAEDVVRALPFRSVHIMRPSLLLGPRPERRRGEALAKTVAPWLAPLLVGTLAKYRPVHARTVATAMVALARQDLRGHHIHYFKD